MMKSNYLSKKMKHIKNELVQYLSETTVHGFRYLVESRNNLERLIWGITICLSMFVAIKMVAENCIYAIENPIITNIETVEIQKVPFPAVTIKSSEDLNQWAFPQKALNTLAFDCADGKYPCSQSEHIRNDFKFLIVEVIKQMNKTLEENAQESNISLLEEWKNYYPDYKTKRYKNLHNVVESMAMISLQNKTIGSYMAHDLQEDYIAHFAEFDPIPHQGLLVSNYIDNNWVPIINNYTKKVGLTTEVKEACRNQSSSCHEDLIDGYKQVLWPFYTWKLRNYDFKFGDFVAYFSRLVSRNSAGHFLFSARASQKEQRLEKFFIKMWQNMTETDQKVSVFELPNLLQAPKALQDPTRVLEVVPRLMMKEPNCKIRAKSFARGWYFWQEQAFSNRYYKHLSEAPCKNSTQAKEFKFEDCCKLSQGLNQFMPQIYSVMKYAMQAPHYIETEDDFLATFKNDLYPGYPMKRLYNRQVTNPAISMCQYAGEPKTVRLDNCQLFSRSITNEGFGYSFNNIDYWLMYKKNNFTETFSDIMIPKGHEKKTHQNINLKSQFPESEDISSIYQLGSVITPKTSGASNTLVLVLESPKLFDHFQKTKLRNDDQMYKSTGEVFRVNVHDPLALPDLRSSVEVEPGYLSTILISPTMHVTDKNTANIAEEKRRCRFHFEANKLKLTRIYSQSGCIFECQLEEALRVCGCVPWNYPHLQERGFSRICDFLGKQCFDHIMANLTFVAIKCAEDICPPECFSNRYSYSVASTLLDPKAICKESSKAKNFAKYWHKDFTNEMGLPMTFIRRFQQVSSNNKVDIGEDKICERYVSAGMAVVKFQLADSTVIKVKKQRRSTIGEVFGSIGGTIGLFTGMSVISLFELVFWILCKPSKARKCQGS